VPLWIEFPPPSGAGSDGKVADHLSDHLQATKQSVWSMLIIVTASPL
jgi:hypothetical protein